MNSLILPVLNRLYSHSLWISSKLLLWLWLNFWLIRLPNHLFFFTFYSYFVFLVNYVLRCWVRCWCWFFLILNSVLSCIFLFVFLTCLRTLCNSYFLLLSPVLGFWRFFLILFLRFRFESRGRVLAMCIFISLLVWIIIELLARNNTAFQTLFLLSNFLRILIINF